MDSDKDEREKEPLVCAGQTALAVSASILNQLRQEAAGAHPFECCGILIGNGAIITALMPAQNVHSDPKTHFTIDPQTLINAHRRARQGGPDILGYYHSHPNGLTRPSATDRAHAIGDGRIWGIIAADEITFWRDEESVFLPLPYATTSV